MAFKSDVGPVVSSIVTATAFPMVGTFFHSRACDCRLVLLTLWCLAGYMAFVCPGVSVAQITARLGLLRYKIGLQLYAALYLLVLLTLLANTTVINCVCVVTAIVAALAVARLRTKMRTLFDIPGHALLDVTSVLVCGPCTVAQMASHAGAYQSGSCSFRARSTLEGYVR